MIARLQRLWRHVWQQPVLVVYAGNMSRALFGFLTGLAVARLLGSAEFGVFSLFIVVMIFCHAIMGEGLDPGVVRFYSRATRHSPGETGRVLGTALGLRTLIGVVLLAVGIVYADAIATRLLGDASLASVVRHGFVCGLVASYSTFTLAVLQARESFVAYSLLAPLVNMLRLATLPVLVATAHLDLQWLMTLHTGLFFLAAMLGTWVLRGEMHGLRFRRDTLTDLFAFSKWTALANLVFLIPIHLAVPLVSATAGVESAGVYMAGLTLLLAIDQITIAIVTSQLPVLSRADSLPELRQYVRRGVPIFLLVAAPLSLFAVAAAPLTDLVYGPAYAQSADILRILLAGFLVTLVTHPLYVVLYALGRPSRYAAASVAGLVAWVIACLLLVPAHGANGAAYAALAARLVQGLVIAVSVVRALWGARPALLRTEVPEVS